MWVEFHVASVCLFRREPGKPPRQVPIVKTSNTLRGEIGNVCCSKLCCSKLGSRILILNPKLALHVKDWLTTQKGERQQKRFPFWCSFKPARKGYLSSQETKPQQGSKRQLRRAPPCASLPQSARAAAARPAALPGGENARNKSPLPPCGKLKKEDKKHAIFCSHAACPLSCPFQTGKTMPKAWEMEPPLYQTGWSKKFIGGAQKPGLADGACSHWGTGAIPRVDHG